jgi:hypothetical protein
MRRSPFPHAPTQPAGLGGAGSDDDSRDVFDWPGGEEATSLFVDPFSCLNVSPLEWEGLQAVAQGGGGQAGQVDSYDTSKLPA